MSNPEGLVLPVHTTANGQLPDPPPEPVRPDPESADLQLAWAPTMTICINVMSMVEIIYMGILLGVETWWAGRTTLDKKSKLMVNSYNSPT